MGERYRIHTITIYLALLYQNCEAKIFTESNYLYWWSFDRLASHIPTFQYSVNVLLINILVSVCLCLGELEWSQEPQGAHME